MLRSLFDTVYSVLRGLTAVVALVMALEMTAPSSFSAHSPGIDRLVGSLVSCDSLIGRAVCSVSLTRIF
jgi:hypothetical protein